MLCYQRMSGVSIRLLADHFELRGQRLVCRLMIAALSFYDVLYHSISMSSYGSIIWF